MKHTYKSMLIAAMALAVGSAGYLTTDLWRHHPAGKVMPAEEVAGVPQSTIEKIKEQIAKQEYHISFDDETKTLQSPNRKQNLRAYYKPGQLTVQNRVDSAGHDFKLHLVNEGIYADGKKILSAQSDARPVSKENKLEIEHDGFTEEFINTEDGVRQNFIVSNAPEDARNLQVRLSAKGLKAQNGAPNEIRFYREDARGKYENFVVYSDLHCWDANKKPLDATLTYVSDHVEINVAVEGAAYPVTIDPILANGNPNTADKTIELDHSNAWLGYAVSSAGDVNGDGYSDVIVGAPKYDWNGVDAGVAYVFPGTANGLSLSGQILNQNHALAQMGYSVASAGDVNKDGYSDVIVGSPYFGENQNNEGGAFLYYGGQPSASAPTGINPANFIKLQPDQAEANFGVSVAMAGDVNADGFSDFMVGAHMYDKDQANEGVVFLYYGGNGGPNFAKTEILDASQSGAMFGYSIAGAGDVNKDGASDILIGARLYTDGELYEGAAYVYLGSINSTPLSASQPLKIQINQADARFGHSLSTAGDVNGDGYADVAIGAYMYDNDLSNEGRVYVHLGGQNGVNPNPHKILEGDQLETQYGWSVASAGDVNGDGYGDLMVGSRYYSNGQNHEGAVFIYRGSPTGLNNAATVSMIESNQADGWLGSAVASAGDVNGDGYSDLVIGCYTYDHGQNDEGQVYIYHGGPDNIGSIARGATSGSVSHALAGSSVTNAGDVNGDGLEDLIVGAPNYDGGKKDQGAVFVHYGSASTGTESSILITINQANAKYGTSVSGAGDVNGDGFDDVIIGSPGYTTGVPIGAAIVLYGGSMGLSPNSANYTVLTFGLNAFGTAVSGAGDINHDGFDDIIVGAPNYGQTKSGAVCVYLGSQAGINAQSQAILTTNLADAHLGNSLDNAGDVNGDGFSDIVVGASQASVGHAGEGFIYVWHGSVQGIPSNTGYNAAFQSNHVGAGLGISVAGAGDVNGDGYADIIAGANKFTNGQSNEGCAWIILGSSTGCTLANLKVLEINQSEAQFGKSVSGGMDVNSDGYSDIVVGAPYYDNTLANEGAAFVFHGSPTGVSSTAAFSATGQQLEGHFGEAVSSAGDLNGDGYGDIIVGFPNYTASGITNGGTSCAFFGNNGNHGGFWYRKRNNVRLYNSNLTDPMSQPQVLNGAFGLGLTTTSSTGRNNGRMVWDLASAGQSYSKPATNAITYSTLSDNGQGGFYTVPGNDLKELVTKPVGTTSRVRVRVKYELATALTGQRFSPWRYSSKPIFYVAPQSVPEEVSNEIFVPKQFAENADRKELVSVYPNPVSERLFIKTDSPDQIKSLQLISTNGSTALTSTRPQTELDVKHLTPGTYILMINRKDGSQTSHRVLIKK